MGDLVKPRGRSGGRPKGAGTHGKPVRVAFPGRIDPRLREIFDAAKNPGDLLEQWADQVEPGWRK